MKLPHRLRRYLDEARTMEPVQETALTGVRRAARHAQSLAIFGLLDVNDLLIGRFAPHHSAVWSTTHWPWIAEVEAMTPAIRKELTSYVGQAGLPMVAAVSGLDPESDEGKQSVPGIVGAWRTVILFANGRWVDETARHFPNTVKAFSGLRGKANVGFSALEARSHIQTHVGPNRGALRFQLPIVVPGQPGDCRIRVGEDTINWREGEAVIFDLSTNHEAWNDSDHLRVLLMVEIPMPLPTLLSWVNRATQHSYRWHPSYRGMPERIAQFGRDHDAAAPATAG